MVRLVNFRPFIAEDRGSIQVYSKWDLCWKNGNGADFSPRVSTSPCRYQFRHCSVPFHETRTALEQCYQLTGPFNNAITIKRNKFCPLSAKGNISEVGQILRLLWETKMQYSFQKNNSLVRALSPITLNRSLLGVR